jgi:hypothetical protein
VNVRIVVAAAWLVVAVPAGAQNVGDALASAGVAVSEDAFLSGLSAIMTDGGGAASTAAGSTLQVQTSLPRMQIEQPPVPGPPPIQPSPTKPRTTAPPSGTTQSSVPPASIGALPPVTGSAVGIAGHGVDPKIVAEWESAYRSVGTTATPPAASENLSATLRYEKGVFYQKSNSGWSVIAAPVGAVISQRPGAAATVVAQSRPYLYYNGTFFVWNAAKHGYEVVKPPQGAIVAQVPNTARKEGACYRYGGTCFRAAFQGSTLVYVVESA